MNLETICANNDYNFRLLSMNMMGNMPNLPNMPNIPLGVPPPNMTGALMQNQLLGIGSPFQGKNNINEYYKCRMFISHLTKIKYFRSNI